MSLDTLFQKVDPVETPEGKPHKHPGCYLIDNVDNKYQENVRIRGMVGTRIPISTPQGSPDKGDCAYGFIKSASKVKLDSDGNLTKCGDLDIPEIRKGDVTKPAKRIKKSKPVVTQVIEEEQEVVETVKPKISKELKSVSISGKFGSYRGKYIDVIKEGNILVLVYDLDAASYTPPTDMTSPLTVNCEGVSYTVYYPGIEFPLTAQNLGFQVMLFGEAN
jgi:hypothetical protein